MKYYFIGIKGSGMSALALILNNLGHEVVGYDDAVKHVFTEDELIKRNIKIYNDNSYNINNADIVVRSSAISDTHNEYIRCIENNIKVYEYNEILGLITKGYKSITVAGCHGKTTTSSMLSQVLNNTLGCNYLIGDGTGYSNSDNEYFVLEACEYKRHFLSYSPYIAIITNIDYDHVDYFKNIDDVFDAYQEYASSAKKMVIAYGDNIYTRKLKVDTIKYYGLKSNNDVIARNIRYRSFGTSFDVYIENKYFGSYNIPLFGEHMVLNSLAVISTCYYERINYKQVEKNLKIFEGARRRFVINEIGDNVTIDDYAHHPEEIRVTINSAKQKYPNKSIVVVFQPHTYSRVKSFINELVEVLNMADKVYIMDIYEAREKQEDYPGINSYTIIEKLKNAEHITLNESDKLLQHKASVIIFMSANDIYELQRDYEKKIIV